MSSEPTITVGELREAMSALPDDHLLSFSGGLSFYRLKRWSDKEHIVEFDEPQGDLTDAFKRRNPHVKVVFIDTGHGSWNEDGLVGEINVEVR